MPKLLISIVISLLAAGFHLSAENKYYKLMADSEMKRNPEAWMLDFSQNPKWNYCHGLVMQSILQVWEKTGDRKYFDYAHDFTGLMISEDGEIKTYKLTEYNIDRINTGKILFPIYAETGEAKLKKAMDLLLSQMETHPRTSEGSYWHKKIYPHQVWLDGIYMACPYLAEYAKTFDRPEIFDDVILQIIDCHKYLHDETTGLYYHGWDESREQRWSNPETGTSPNFWSRGIGWYMMAIVDVLDYLPEDHPQRNDIIHILQNAAASIENFRDPETGMWWQVTNMGGREGNYNESSASAMFIYSWIKGEQKGYLDKKYKEKGEKAYDQYIARFLKTEADGTLSITDGCSVGGLGGEKNYRDGTFEYYISEPIRDNDPKAVGPFIMLSILLDR